MTAEQRKTRFEFAFAKVLDSKEGQIFWGYITSKGGLTLPQTDPAKLAVQQFIIGLMADFDLYTTDGNFQIDYIGALRGLPRSKKREKLENE